MSLFDPVRLGRLELPNRIVMAPMTRSRAAGNVPTASTARYYALRASAGLLIAEGTAPSPNGLGYPRIPGVFSDEQVAGWRGVTDAVHAAGGRIFIQVMHTGRIGHPANLPAGGRLLAPSAIAAPGTMYTDSLGLQPHPEPAAMSAADIRDAIGEFAHAARQAIAAGADGIELHGANGYLIDQFLNPASNQRSDGYGGSVAARIRFAVEVAEAVAGAIGPDRVGIRISPNGKNGGMVTDADTDDLFLALARELSRIGVVYLHVTDHAPLGAPPLGAAFTAALRATFRGAYVLSGGYDRARAEADLAAGKGDLVAFGRPFLANPGLVGKLRDGRPLLDPDMSTLFTPGDAGYLDWPVD
jgi:N-ethylmaleimide reductase